MTSFQRDFRGFVQDLQKEGAEIAKDYRSAMKTVKNIGDDLAKDFSFTSNTKKEEEDEEKGESLDLSSSLKDFIAQALAEADIDGDPLEYCPAVAVVALSTILQNRSNVAKAIKRPTLDSPMSKVLQFTAYKKGVAYSGDKTYNTPENIQKIVDTLALYAKYVY